MASRQWMLAMELEDIETEKFDRSLAKHQIHQYFPFNKLRYTVYNVIIKSMFSCTLKILPSLKNQVTFLHGWLLYTDLVISNNLHTFFTKIPMFTNYNLIF